MRREEFSKIGLIILLVWILLAVAPLSPLPVDFVSMGRKLQIAREENDAAGQADALAYFAKAQPWRSDLLKEAGLLKLEAGQPEAAIWILEEDGVRSLLTPEEMIKLAEAYLAVGQVEKAGMIWVDLAGVGAGTISEIYWQVVMGQYQAGDLAAARVSAKAWVAAWPNDAAANYWQGLFSAVEDPQQAAGLVMRAAELDNHYREGAVKIAEAAALAGESDDFSYRCLVMGRMLGTLGQWPLAEEAFKQAVEASPGYAEAWALLGQAQLQRGADGQAALQRAEELNPESVLVRAALGLYWREHGDPQKALEYFTSLAEQQMQACIWPVEVGRTEAQLGHLSIALAYFQRAVDIEPENSDCWRELAAFSFSNELEVSETGLPAARRVLEMRPDEAASYDLMGLGLLAGGDRVNAEKFLLQALERDADYAPAHIHLAQVYILDGSKREQAAAHLLFVLEHAPDSTYAAIAEKLLKEYVKP